MTGPTATEYTTEKLAVARCSFCGTEKTAQIPLIAGNEGHICEECVKLAHQVVNSWGRTRKNTAVREELKTPRAINAFLDDYIIGQEEAKRTLSVAVYNHYLRLTHEARSQPFSHGREAVEMEKSNVLLAGPSGTGKTLLVKTLARIIGVPFVIGDATSLTQAGYVGDDVDSLLRRLLDAAEGDVQQAQWGIVYIDEIDKLARRGGGAAAVRDISGEGVQQALLKMVEGAEVRLSKSGRRDGGEEAVIHTHNILFIVGGAFPGLTELIEKRLRPDRAGIGFSAAVEENRKKISNDELLRAMLPDDLRQFGLIPEFIGRFPVITFLEEMDAATLLRILREPRNSLVRQFGHLFACQGVELEFSEPALLHIAQAAVEHGTGARGLRAILETLLRATMFDLPSRTDLRRCVVALRGESDSERELYIDEVAGAVDEDAGVTQAGERLCG